METPHRPIERIKFIHPLDGYSFGKAWTAVELRMQRLSYALRSKPSWWTKYKNPEIRAKWKTEAMEQVIMDGMLTEAEVEYVLDELAGYEDMRDHENGIQQSCFGRIFESDTLISNELCEKLKSAVAKLENIPEEEKDWHPRSNQMVLDLVHPSLYCLVYRRTLSFPKDSESRTSSDLKPTEAPTLQPWRRREQWTSSEKYAWIPTEFQLGENGAPAKALSYINNIHPSEKELYEVIEAIVGRFSLMFTRVLTELTDPSGYLPHRLDGGVRYPDGEPDLGSDDDYAEFRERRDEWRRNEAILPTLGGPYEKHIWGDFTPYPLDGRKVQVIVKLASHHLTPEKPSYDGGSWHIEGMANERIIASGIYYYDSENVEENNLAFRTAVSDEDLDYQQGDEVGTDLAYGLERESECNQDLGSVKTIPGRCIAFSNLYQHQVSPFSLIDKTKPGHRKIMALFLVDPTVSIPSTSDIPPQQSEWAREAIGADEAASPFSKLPAELLEMVMGSTGTMTLAEAKKYREELMDERTAAVDTQNEWYFATEFNLCEH